MKVLQLIAISGNHLTPILQPGKNKNRQHL
jgi:hypothetical protein